MNKLYSHRSLMKAESPRSRKPTPPSSLIVLLRRNVSGVFVATVAIVLVLIVLLTFRTSPKDLHVSSHRKLGGHDTTAVVTQDSAVAENSVLGDASIRAEVNLGAKEVVETLETHHEDPDTISEKPPQKQPILYHPPPPRGLYALHAKTIDGHRVLMSEYAGKVLLIVNVASACGYTDTNYKGLQALYEKYGDHGLEILAFPCNQFGGQEPGTDEQIKSFATSKYGVTFPMMSKVEVNGPDAAPVFKYLKRNLPVSQGGGGGVGHGKEYVWNFQKVLVDRQGRPSFLFHQKFDAAALEAEIYKLLTES